VNRVSRWRIAAALLVVAGLGLFAARVGPIYIHNLQLQNFVGDFAAQPQNLTLADDLVRARVLERARALDLPVTPDNVKIMRGAKQMRIDVRYIVRVDLPGYTVDLHFYPGAGSR